MNRLLIGILDIINKLLALLIIVSSTIEGYRGDFFGSFSAQPSGDAPPQILWAIVGFVIGLALAGMVSGLIAAIITIAREVTALRELMALRIWTNPTTPAR